MFAHHDVKIIQGRVNVFTGGESKDFSAGKDRFVHRGEFEWLMLG